MLSDRSGRYSPDEWATRAVNAYEEFHADYIVAEANFGGAMVEATIKTVDPKVPVRMVRASRGKVLRAQPIAALYEQGRVHHVGRLTDLEGQLTTWTEDSRDSPDRLDALVWALTEVMEHGASGSATVATWKEGTPLDPSGLKTAVQGTWAGSGGVAKLFTRDDFHRPHVEESRGPGTWATSGPEQKRP